MRNLIFVGLPGSGKSTVGRLAARTLGLPFVDADKALSLIHIWPIYTIFRPPSRSRRSSSSVLT